MKVTYNKDEVDSRTLKLIVGLIALFLAIVTSFLTNGEIKSISASYHYGGLARDIFVGCLFAIASFLFAYNGQEPEKEALISKIAALAALGVALFPCACCDENNLSSALKSACKADLYNISGGIHLTSAAIMFVILARFCKIFYNRAKDKFLEDGNLMAKRRSYVYAISGITIVLSISIPVLDFLLGKIITDYKSCSRLLFYCESAGLFAFSASWLTSSKVLPFMALEHEKLHVLKK